MSRPRNVPALLPLVLAAAVWLPRPVTSQEVTLAPVLQALAGTWEGEGVLLGNAAAFSMTWTPLEGSFVRLAFSNMWIDENGDTVPVLDAEATYRVDGSTALGVWLDSRPQQLTLTATLDDSSVSVDWVAPAETGRTEYVLTGPNQAIVRDYVIAGGTPRLFAEGTYTRVPATSR